MVELAGRLPKESFPFALSGGSAVNPHWLTQRGTAAPSLAANRSDRGATDRWQSKTEGGKGRIIPLSETALACLKEWRSQFPDAHPGHYVFPSGRYGLNGEGENGHFGGKIRPYAVRPTVPIGSWKTAWTTPWEEAKDSNPAAAFKPCDVLKPRKTQHRARVETNQLPKLLVAIDGFPGHKVWRDALKLMAMLFVRTGELLEAPLSEFDLTMLAG